MVQRSPSSQDRSWYQQACQRLPAAGSTQTKRYSACVAGWRCRSACHAASYPLPPVDERLFGELSYDVVAGEDTLVDVARRNRLGYDEVTLANPDVDHWLPKPGTRVVLPTRFILPWGEREGIVVNLAEYRLYYFPKPQRGAPRSRPRGHRRRRSSVR